MPSAISGGRVNLSSPGPIGGTTPGAGSFTTLSATTSARLLNSTLDANFVRENTTNNGGGTVGLAELVLKCGIAGSNVLALENTAVDGFSALTCRDNGGNETFAIGYGNASAAAPFSGINYIETWSLSGVAPDFAIFADGDFGATGSGFRRYKATDWAWSAADSVYRFSIWHNIPIGTTQRRAFYVEVGGNVSSFAKFAIGASDCSLQFWKDATPTKAIHYGLGAPGGAAGSDHLFYCYTGSAWVLRMKLKNGADGTASLNLPGLPTSAAGLAAGDVWNNLGILTIV